MADIVIDPNQVNLYFDEPAMRRLVNHVMVNQEETIESAINALASQEAPDEWMIVGLWQKLLHRVWTFIFSSYETEYNASIEKINLYVVNLLKEADEAGTIPAPASAPAETKTGNDAANTWWITDIFYSIFSVFSSSTPAPTETKTTVTEGGAEEDATVPVVRSLAEKLEIVKKFYPEDSSFTEVARLYPKKAETTETEDEEETTGDKKSEQTASNSDQNSSLSASGELVES